MSSIIYLAQIDPEAVVNDRRFLAQPSPQTTQQIVAQPAPTPVAPPNFGISNEVWLAFIAGAGWIGNRSWEAYQSRRAAEIARDKVDADMINAAFAGQQALIKEFMGELHGLRESIMELVYTINARIEKTETLAQKAVERSNAVESRLATLETNSAERSGSQA
jgi:hypothetical protein